MRTSSIFLSPADANSAVGVIRNRFAQLVPLVLATVLIVGALAPLPAQGQDPPASYRLTEGDRLSFAVEEAPELGRSYQQVMQDGTLKISDSMGVISVAGLTAAEAELAIQRRLERDLISATVTVTIDTVRDSKVRLLGAVANPGERTISLDSTLFGLLTQTNELNGPNAGTIEVRRRSQSLGIIEQISVPLDALLRDFDPRFNLPLQDGDLITIPPDLPITVYFAGEINREVKFAAAETKTLLRAIVKAGGLTDRASNKIEITRTHADGTSEIIEARYKRILTGRDPDIVLQENDLIVVKKSVI